MTEPAAPGLRAGSSWAVASVAVALAAGLLRTIVSARFLEPAELGLLGIALLALGFVEAMSSPGLDTALVAIRRDIEQYIDAAFTIQLARGILVFGFLWAAAPAIAWVFGNDAATGIIRAVAPVALLRGLSNPAVAVPIRRLDFRLVFWWSLPEILISLALTLVLLVALDDVRALVIGLLAGQAAGTLASYGLVPRRPHLTAARERMVELLRFGRFVSGARALMYVSVYVDATIVGLTMGTHTLGLYQFATRIAELPVVTFTRAIAQVALPTLSGLRGSTAAVTRTWRTMLGYVLAVNSAAALGIILFGEMAVRIVAGPHWGEAVPIMRILAIATVFRAVVVLTGQLLDALGEPARTMKLNAARLAVLLLVLPALGGFAGVLGVAAGVLLANAGSAALALRLSSRVLAGGR